AAARATPRRARGCPPRSRSAARCKARPSRRPVRNDVHDGASLMPKTLPGDPGDVAGAHPPELREPGEGVTRIPGHDVGVSDLRCLPVPALDLREEKQLGSILHLRELEIRNRLTDEPRDLFVDDRQRLVRRNALTHRDGELEKPSVPEPRQAATKL